VNRPKGALIKKRTGKVIIDEMVSHFLPSVIRVSDKTTLTACQSSLMLAPLYSAAAVLCVYMGNFRVCTTCSYEGWMKVALKFN